MKVIRTYSMLVPAQLAQLELGSYGIRAEILDEGVALNTPHFAMVSGIRLAVDALDEEKAVEILDAALAARAESADDD